MTEGTRNKPMTSNRIQHKCLWMWRIYNIKCFAPFKGDGGLRWGVGHPPKWNGRGNTRAGMITTWPWYQYHVMLPWGCAYYHHQKYFCRVNLILHCTICLRYWRMVWDQNCNTASDWSTSQQHSLWHHGIDSGQLTTMLTTTIINFNK